MEELIKFKYNDYEMYLLYDGKKTYYAKGKDGQIDYNVSDNDRTIIKFVYKKVMPSKNIKPRSNINFEGKTYAHFVDDKSIHMFYELKENKLFIPEKEVRKQLNYLYNNQEELVYDGKESDIKNKKFFKRLINIGKEVLVVLVATSAILGYDYLNQNRNVIIEDDIPVIALYDDSSKTKSGELSSKDDLETLNPLTDDDINPPTDEYVNPLTGEDMNPPTEYYVYQLTDDDINPPTDDDINSPTDDNINPLTDEEDLLDIAQEMVAEVSYKQTDNYKLAGDDFHRYYLENNLPNEIIKIYDRYPELKNVPIIINHQGYNVLLTYNEKDGYVSLSTNIFTGEYENINMEIPKELKDAFPDDNIATVKEKKIELHFDDIAKILNLNPFLSQDEKNFIISNPKYIMDNLKYMDHNYILKMLLNLRIEYKPEKNLKFTGTYGNYLITLYDSLDFNYCNKPTLSHELCHAFSCPKSKSFNRYIELINGIITNEYWGAGNYYYDKGYGDLKLEGYALMELIGTEPVIKAYFKNDTKEIKESLMAIINDEEMANELLEILDTNVSLLQDREYSLCAEGKEKFNNLYKGYYEAKYQKSILDNEEVMYYLYPSETAFSILSKVTDEANALEFRQRNLSIGSLTKPKCYFNNINADDNSPVIELYRKFSVVKDNSKETVSFYLIDPVNYALNYGVLEENLQR